MQPFPSRRSPVLGTGGMVATSQPLAAMAGARQLLDGGSAVDAAVAAAAALAVVEPTGCGLGGDAFALCYDARTRRVTAYDGSGAAPRAADSAALRAAGHAAVPARGAWSITVPGAVDAWAALTAAAGTRPLAALLAPAMDLAEGGYPVSERIAAAWRASEGLLAADAAARRHLLFDGQAPRPGQVVRLPAMGRSLRAVAEGGRDALYGGPLGTAMADAVAAAGGWLTADDLARHRGRWVEPIAVDGLGWRVWQCPPPGQGLATLVALGVADGLLAAAGGAAAWPWGEVDHLHHLIEAMRLGFAEADAHVADPDAYAAPVAALLDPRYLAERRARVAPDRAMPPPTTGVPRPGGTVYVAAVDAAGNGCSLIQSNYMGFGSGLVAGDSGIPLQNRGAGFTLAPDHPNCLAGGRRPFHTIIPGLATEPRDGALRAVFGVMGGHMQPQGQLQLLANLRAYGLDVQQALDAPRFQLLPDGRLALEPGFADRAHEALARRGHTVVPRDATPSAATFGGGQVIAVDGDGVRHGGSDPRKDGCALAT